MTNVRIASWVSTAPLGAFPSRMPRGSSTPSARSTKLLLPLVIASLLVGAAGLATAQGLKEMNPPDAPRSQRIVALVGGRLIDGRGGEPVENATVVLRGSVIGAAGPSDAISVPEGAKRVDASGLTIVPGLIDAHYHSVNDLENPALFLSHGVTTFRDPGHPFRFYQAVSQTNKPMPRVFVTGAHLDAYPPVWPQQAVLIENAEQARKTVNEHVDRGASAIKIYFRLPREMYPVVCATAKRRGVPVTAHLELVPADEAIRAGLEGIEHVTSFGTALAEPKAAAEFTRIVTERSGARREHRYLLWADIDLEESSRVKPLLDLIVERKAVVSPTLAVFERRPGDKRSTAVHARAFEKMLRFVGLCHEAGALIVVGSHRSVPHAETGWAYQRELELLVEAGLTPLEAITAGTLVNARFFRAEDRLGTIEAGKAADLVLVEGNPARDIRAMYDVRHVMLNGLWVTETPDDATE